MGQKDDRMISAKVPTQTRHSLLSIASNTSSRAPSSSEPAPLRGQNSPHDDVRAGTTTNSPPRTIVMRHGTRSASVATPYTYEEVLRLARHHFPSLSATPTWQIEFMITGACSQGGNAPLLGWAERVRKMREGDGVFVAVLAAPTGVGRWPNGIVVSGEVIESENAVRTRDGDDDWTSDCETLVDHAQFEH